MPRLAATSLNDHQARDATLTRAPSPNPPLARYPPPMQPANKALNQHTPAQWRAAPVSSASTTTYGSAPNSRGVVSHGRKNRDKHLVAKTNTPATTTPPKQPPTTPAPQTSLPAINPEPAKGVSPPACVHSDEATTCKGSGKVQEER